MRVAYFDCFSGVSGDMCLAAIVDAGVPLGELGRQLKLLPVSGYSLDSRTVRRAGLSSTRVDVRILKKSPAARTWRDVRDLVSASRLPEAVKKQGTEVFRRLFAAEAKVHGTTIAKTHLHELGAVDCLVDVFGTLIGLRVLGVERVYASALNLGSGTVSTAHGTLPVPAPATVELLRGVPVYSSGAEFELTTPTGAAIVRTLAGEFGPLPSLRCERIGYGAGRTDPADHPNVLRLVIGTADRAVAQDSITVIETNIDDMNPQVYGRVMDRLFAEGALDVFLTQIMMKKTRPAVKLTVLCSAGRRDDLVRVLFAETTTIGVRHYTADRTTMDREPASVRTAFGPVKTKIARSGGIVKQAPEYESCLQRARQQGVPLLQVLDAARKTAGTEKKR